MSGAEASPAGGATAQISRAYLLEQQSGGVQLPMQPVLLPGQTAGSMTDRICALALRERAFLWWWVLLVPFALMFLLGVCSGFWLFYRGPGVWGVDWPVMWSEEPVIVCARVGSATPSPNAKATIRRRVRVTCNPLVGCR